MRLAAQCIMSEPLSNHLIILLHILIIILGLIYEGGTGIVRLMIKEIR